MTRRMSFCLLLPWLMTPLQSGDKDLVLPCLRVIPLEACSGSSVYLEQ
jgi:hypothetical protein